MPTYSKRPMNVDAMQFSEAGDNAGEVIAWARKLPVVENIFDQDQVIFCMQVPVEGNEDQVHHVIAARTADGQILGCGPGDYIIRNEVEGVDQDAFLFVAGETFEKVYTKVILQ